MPKNQMGWVKRTQEKQKKEEEDVKKRELDAQKAAQILLQQQMLAMMNSGTGVPLGNAARASAIESTQRLRPPSGPQLPRESVDLPPQAGEVLEWKGKFGWIQPSGRINHPLARRHGGRVYLSHSDLEDCQALQTGDMCEFTLYSDSSGLGAGHCKKTSSGAGGNSPSPAVWASGDSSGPAAWTSGDSFPSAWADGNMAWTSPDSWASGDSGGGSVAWASGDSPGPAVWASGGSSCPAAWGAGDSSGAAAWAGGGSAAWAGVDSSGGWQ